MKTAAVLSDIYREKEKQWKKAFFSQINREGENDEVWFRVALLKYFFDVDVFWCDGAALCNLFVLL